MRVLLLALLLTLGLAASASTPTPIVAAIIFEHCGNDLGVMLIKADGDARMVRTVDAVKDPDLLKFVKEQLQNLPPAHVHVVDDAIGCEEV